MSRGRVRARLGTETELVDIVRSWCKLTLEADNYIYDSLQAENVTWLLGHMHCAFTYHFVA